MTVIRLAELRDDALSVDEVLGAVADPAAGGIALFTGAVRDHDHGPRRAAAVLQRAPSAAAQLRQVCEKVAADHPVTALAAVHRVGDLAIGDLAVVVAVSCPHRAEAFAACRALIDSSRRASRSGSTRYSATARASGSTVRSLHPMSRRTVTLLVAGIGVVAAALAAALLPVPYVILQPGPDAEHAGPDLRPAR